jgi:tetratricopeptide (TPR) repeat protein
MGMKEKNSCFWLLPLILLLIPVFSFAQESAQDQFTRRFQNGSQLYVLSRWYEAGIEFRRAQESAGNINDWAHALYWVILSELGSSDYGSALRDMEELERNASNSIYARDMVYHRARVYFNQGHFEDSLFLFNRYNSSVTDTDRVSSERRAAAFFWMGECLYAMGQFAEAEKFYAWVLERYPESPKIQAASYRIDLIIQKKIEAELLALLQWSHEEALRTSEDYQRTIRTYEYTLNIYQRRIAELTPTAGLLNLNQVESESPETPTPAVIRNENPPVLEGIFLPEEIIPVTEDGQSNPNESLIERARQLGSDVQQILRDNDLGR